MGNSRSSTASRTTTRLDRGFMNLAQLAVFDTTEPTEPQTQINNDIENENVQAQNDVVSSSAGSSTEYSSYTTSSTMSSELSSISGASDDSFANADSLRGGLSSPSNLRGGGNREIRIRTEFTEDLNLARSGNQTRFLLLLLAQAFLSLCFLYLLLQKFQSNFSNLWLIVLMPLILSLWFRIINEILDLFKIFKVALRYREHEPLDQTKFCCLIIPFETIYVGMPILLNLIDNIGDFLTLLVISFYLDQTISHSIQFIILFTPFWCELFIGSLIRCFGSHNSYGANQWCSLLAMLKSFAYLALKGLPAVLITLRLDGTITISWAAVFSPWWIFLFILAFLSCCMCMFVQALDPLRLEQLEASQRLNFSRKWNLMIKSMACFLLLIGSFLGLFLYRLSRYLDGKEHFTYLELLLPLFVIFSCTIVCCPPLFIANSRIEEFRKNIELSRGREDLEANTEMRPRKPKMKNASTSMLLLRHSATVFKRAKDSTQSEPPASSVLPSSSPVHDQSDDAWADTEEESKPCYICEASQSNGVLMECGHGGLCYSCGLELARKGQTCPLCRAVIAEVIQIESTSLSFGVAISSTQVKVSARGHKKGDSRASSHRGRGIAV